MILTDDGGAYVIRLRIEWHVTVTQGGYTCCSLGHFSSSQQAEEKILLLRVTGKFTAYG